MFGVFRVKNHDFTQKNHIFSNFRGRVRPSPPLNPPLQRGNQNSVYRRRTDNAMAKRTQRSTKHTYKTIPCSQFNSATIIFVL